MMLDNHDKKQVLQSAKFSMTHRDRSCNYNLYAVIKFVPLSIKNLL